MALHFRRLVAIIIGEYISQKLNKKNIIEISLNEYNNFLESLKKPRATISCLVRDILIILCGNCAVDDSANNVLAMWIRRKYPLSSVSNINKLINVWVASVAARTFLVY